MASVYWRSDLKTYYARIKINGRWTGVPTGTDEEEKALAFARQIQKKAKKGKLPEKPETAHTVQALIGGYLAYGKSRRWKPATLTSRTGTLALLKKRLASNDIDDLNQRFAQEFQAWLSANKKSAHTVNHHLRNARAFVRYVHRFILRDWKPPIIQEIAAAGTDYVDNFSKEEFAAFMRAAVPITLNGESVAPFFLFLRLTGMRRGEVLACRWSWVHADGIHVPPVTKTMTKRVVPISKPLRELLDRLPRKPKERLFPAMTIEVSRKFQDALEAMNQAGGVTIDLEERPMHLHNLRDTFIVQALIKGIPAFMVAKMVGNSVRVIEQNYTVFAEQELKQFVPLLDADLATDALLTCST